MANNYGSLEGTMDANGILGGEIQFNGAGGRVKDVQVNDVSVVDANGVAKIDLTPYAEKEDVYDKQTIDTALEGKADTDDIPTDLSDLQDDSDHRLVTDAEKTEWSGKADTSDIPTDLADLNDDATHRLVTDTEKSTWDNKADVSDIPTVNNPTITIQKNGQNVDTFTLNQTANKVIDISVPTKTSDLQNDSSFITNTVNNLANYYLKSDTYTQTEVNNLISAAVNGRFEKVTTLPASGEPNVIYLVPKTTALTNNVYDEYIWQDNAWELLGSTEIDLSNYVTTTDLSTALADYVTSSTFNTTISNYYTKTEVGNLLDSKVDKINGKGLSTNDYDNTAKGIVDGVTNALAGKVDKVNGKGLSTEDYTTTEKNKLAGISTNAKKVEASTTNGNIKIDGTETQVYDDSEIQDKIDGTTTSISGNPISINGLKSNQLAKNPIITLEPIQDLHGQSKPYPAGGGSNRWDEVWEVGAIKGNDGQPTPYSNRIRSSNFCSCVAGTTYYAYIGFNVTLRVFWYDSSQNFISYSDGNPCVAPNNASYFKIETEGSTYGENYRKDISINYPATVTSYAPYENICPINGYDKVEALSCGKNLFDGTYSSTGNYLKSDGTEYAGTYNISQYISVKANTAYYFSNLSGTTSACICWYNKAKEFISSQSITAGFTSTSPANACYVRASVRNTTTNVCINEGSSAITFEDYHKTTDLSESLGQTVYLGELDVRSGKFKVVGAIKDMGDMTWSYDSGYSRFLTTDLSSVIEKPAAARTQRLWFSCYECVTDGRSMAEVTNGQAYSGATGAVYAHDDRYTDGTVFKTAVAGQKIVYPLATPTEIQLTPHEISLLKDYAYVSTNGTNIALDYHNGELASLADVNQLAETVEKIEKYNQKIGVGNMIDVSGYTTAQNVYVFPSDGYLYLNSQTNTSGKVQMNLYGYNDGVLTSCGGFNMTISASYQYTNLYVRKGMACRVVSAQTGCIIGFYPLV